MNAAKQRLYNAYVSSGQAPNLTVSLSGESLFAGNRPYVDARIRQHLPSNRNARIVDLGCGNGCYLYCIGQYGYTNILGVDTSAEQVAVAHGIGMKNVMQESIEAFLHRDAEAMDVVLLMDIIEHLTLTETLSLLDELYARLRPGGKLLLHIPNAEGLFGMRIRYGDLTHEQSFTPSSMRQLLKTVGFSQHGCYEDRPVVHGPVSALRRVIWEVGTMPYRLLLKAETGGGSAILSQNMLVVATK